MKAKELRQFLDKFLVSPIAQNARIQIEMPNGEKLDVSEIQLLESRVIGDRDSPHQISFHVKHPKNTFILVACTPDRGLVRLYSGLKILQLVDFGLKLEPLCAGWDACRLELERL
jgi:hypothetical protein